MDDPPTIGEIEVPAALQTFLDHAPGTGPWLFIVAALAGLALWLLGRKLARPMCSLTGILAGAAIALTLPMPLAVGEGLPATLKQLVWVLLLALAGAVMAWLLFRVWMGLTCAVVLGVALPTAVLLWQGAPAKEAPEQGEDLFIDTGEAAPSAGSAPAPTVEDPPSSAGPSASWHDQLSGALRAQGEAAREWWGQRQAGVRTKATVLVAIGLVAGLIFGIAAPSTAAGVQSALVGSALMLLAAVGLLHGQDAEQLPWPVRDPPSFLAAAGLITSLGVVLQWTVFRRRADR